MPFFSIISPVYNTSAYLNKFIDTVIDQEFSDFELILVDDGSTDDSLNICRERAEKDKRITVITQQNQGAGAARNSGIEKAKGEYLLFFDSDDYVDISALETLHKALKSRSPEILIFGAQWVSFSESEKETAKTELIPEKLELNSERRCRDKFCSLMFSSVLNPPWNKAYSRDFIVSNDLRFPDARRAQDAFFNMECFRKLKSLCTIGDTLYYYRENTKKKVWKKFPKDLYKIDIQYNSTLENICREFGVSPEWLRDGIGEPFKEVTRNKRIEGFVEDILTNEPEGRKARLVDALASLDEEGWDKLYEIALRFVAEQNEKNEREQLHEELDRQLDEEKGAEGIPCSTPAGSYWTTSSNCSQA